MQPSDYSAFEKALFRRSRCVLETLIVPEFAACSNKSVRSKNKTRFLSFLIFVEILNDLEFGGNQITEPNESYDAHATELGLNVSVLSQLDFEVKNYTCHEVHSWFIRFLMGCRKIMRSPS